MSKVSRLASSMQKAFGSSLDDAVRASKGVVKNGDNAILSFMKKNKIDVSDVISKDASYLGMSSDMAGYASKTSIFKNSDDFGRFLSNNYGDDLGKSFQSYYDNNSMMKSLAGDSDAKIIKDFLNGSDLRAVNSNVDDTIGNISNIKRPTTGGRVRKVGATPSDVGPTPTTGKSVPPTVAGHKQLKGSRYDSLEDYMKFKASDNIQPGYTALKSGSYDNEVLKMVSAHNGKDIRSLTSADIDNYRNSMISKVSGSDATLVDQMGYNKIPQKATGIIGTAWLVNQLAADKGQQSNAQLYNQQSYQ